MWLLTICHAHLYRFLTCVCHLYHQNLKRSVLLFFSVCRLLLFWWLQLPVMFPTNWWRAIQMPFLKEPSSRTLMVFEPLLIMWPWIAVWNTTLLQCHCNPEEVLPCLPNAKAVSSLFYYPWHCCFFFWKISFMYHCLTRGHPLSTSLPRAGWGTTQLPWCIFMPYRAIKLAQGASAALLMGDDYPVPWNASIKAKPRIWQFWPSVRSVSGKGLAWRTCKSDWMALMSIKAKP